MKVQLIVVRGKPEGKVIPLNAPIFRIGRGETCHLRPNSELVSREHAEFAVSGDAITVRDLGSRNGTLVNGKAIAEACRLKDRDLVQVGPLTFAVAIQGAPAPAKAAVPAPAAKPASPDDVDNTDIESWLIADQSNPTPERPSGVYGGETLTMSAFKDAKNAAAQPPAVDDEEGAEEPEPFEEEQEEPVSAETETAEEYVDESNPFHVKKKEPEGPVKPVYKDTSDAASEILRKMMERRKASRGS